MYVYIYIYICIEGLGFRDIWGSVGFIGFRGIP